MMQQSIGSAIGNSAAAALGAVVDAGAAPDAH